jgi:hypothetical protein
MFKPEGVNALSGFFCLGPSFVRRARIKGHVGSQAAHGYRAPAAAASSARVIPQTFFPGKVSELRRSRATESRGGRLAQQEHDGVRPLPTESATKQAGLTSSGRPAATTLVTTQGRPAADGLEDFGLECRARSSAARRPALPPTGRFERREHVPSPRCPVQGWRVAALWRSDSSPQVSAWPKATSRLTCGHTSSASHTAASTFGA